VRNLAQKGSPNFSGGTLCTRVQVSLSCLSSDIGDSPHLCFCNAQEQYAHIPCHETISRV